MSQQLGMVEYVAMAKANLAWRAWRQSRPNDATSLGDEALALWHGMEDPYGVDWQAILPLTAVALEQRRISEAIAYVRGLFRDTQHPLPAELASAAKKAIATFDAGQVDAASARLDDVTQVARKITYL
jgi:hypothetical protein